MQHSFQRPMTYEHAARVKRGARALLDAYPFRPPRWLRSGHAQTLYPHFFRREAAPPLALERLPTPDGDLLALHHLPADRYDVPRIIVVHGLEGSIDSSYVRGLLCAFAAIDWPVTVMEHRSCDGRETNNLRLYHSGDTEDVAHVVREAVRREPARPILVCGFSLGANQVLKWLGESREAIPSQVIGAVAVSAPFDLGVSAHQLDRVLFGVYGRHFLRTLIPKAVAKAEKYPHAIDITRVRAVRTCVDFDDCASARLHGFADAKDYWSRGSCTPFLPAIRVPTLLISAADDPICPGHTFPHDVVDASEHLIPQLTPHGGHTGFMQGTPKRMHSWLDAQLVRYSKFIHAAARDVNDDVLTQ